MGVDDRRFGWKPTMAFLRQRPWDQYLRQNMSPTATANQNQNQNQN
jgi:hypothetical protein